MIALTSYSDKKTKKAFDQLVGPAFSIWDILKKGRVGSAYFKVAALRLGEYFPELQQAPDVRAVLELRPNGILVHLKHRNDTYAWALPFYQMHLYHTDHLGIYGQGLGIQLYKDKQYEKNQGFLRILEQAKADFHERFPPLEANPPYGSSL
ncbi:MAG: hypothetical protein ACO3G5_07880 [Flavobacteriaceae bacterium]